MQDFIKQNFIKQGCTIIILASLFTGCASSGTYDISGQSPSTTRVMSASSMEVTVLESPVAAISIAEPVDIQKRDNRVEGNLDALSYPVKQTKTDPLSTFSVDVDTASYTILLDSLKEGLLPPANAIRTEELINAFDYDYQKTEDLIGLQYQFFKTPWQHGNNKNTHLLKLALNTRETDWSDAPAQNLVLVIDVSGSMAGHKLEMAKRSIELLMSHLREQDRISVITYSSEYQVLAKNVSKPEFSETYNKIHRLAANGSTNGSAALNHAYELAENYNTDANMQRRVLIFTDGDFNFGLKNADSLEDFIEAKRNHGTYLSVVGIVGGYYADERMEIISNHGNGNYIAITNNLDVEDAFKRTPESLLDTLANDVKIQVEFNPTVVAEYRLLGYQNRLLQNEDFNNDKVDSAEMNSGDQVTALYEVVLQQNSFRFIDESRYTENDNSTSSRPNELAFVKLKYKNLLGEKSHELNWSILSEVVSPDSDSLWTAGVAASSLLLREDSLTGNLTTASVIELLNSNTLNDFKRMDYVRHLKAFNW